MVELTIRRERNALGVTLPVEAIKALRVAEGDPLTKDHPIVDGNKRVAFIAVGVLLELSGQKTVSLKCCRVYTAATHAAAPGVSG